MTADELTAMERRALEQQRLLGPDCPVDAVALIAEVRRLRGLITRVEWDGGDGDTGNCLWCNAYCLDNTGHRPDCPAFGQTSA